jgi:autophagy-related protein 27
MRASALPLLATSSALLPLLSLAISFDCSHIRAHGKKFNFEKIGGPHTVSKVEEFPPSIHNTTWAVDLCGTLKKDKNLPAGDQCPGGSYGRHCRAWVGGIAG